MSVTVLHLGAQKRYETYDPHTPFSDAAEKIYRALVELLPEDIRPELPAEITRGMPT